MKKIILNMLVLTFIILSNKVYGISESFKFAIDTVGIPRYNAYGDEINEEVYYAYNIFSYGEPKTIENKNQRWKNSKYGYWTKNGGMYKGSGTRGEYYIIGKSYSGALIYNYYFPMDVMPNTTPDKWTFYKYPEAAASWKDKSKYKYEEQLEYMKTKNLMFNDISSRAKADNPQYIREYDITAEEIGLSKARLDVAATWKTYGMISTRRKIPGVIYSQVYLVKPMSASANVQSNIVVGNNYILEEDKDELAINISYSTEVINMSGYAKAEHIKEITSNLYINGERVDGSSGSKIISVGNEYMLIVTRDKFPQNENHSVKILVDGYMHTEFVVDGLMRSKVSKEISVYVEPKLIIPVKESNLKILEKNALDWVVRPLAQTYELSTDSIGFTEAGKYLVAKLELNVERKDIENINVYIDEMQVEDIHIYDTNTELGIRIKIPKTLKTSLYGMYSLRAEEDSYFKADSNEIGSRATVPHVLKICFNYKDKEYVEEILFDTLDTYLTNINTQYNKSLINNENIMKLSEWIDLNE